MKNITAVSSVIILTTGLIYFLINFGIFDNWFIVARIKVEGNQYTTTDEIVKKSGIQLKDDLYHLNFDSSNREILRLPYVKGVMISRFLPNQIIIKVSEHHPIASYWKENKWILISENGTVLPLVNDIDLGKVPEITGIKTAKENMGGTIKSVELAEAYETVLQVFKNPVVYGYSGKIEMRNDGRVQIYLIKSMTRVMANRTGLQQDLLKLSLFLKQSKNLDYLQSGEYINLCFKDRVIIKKV